MISDDELHKLNVEYNNLKAKKDLLLEDKRSQDKEIKEVESRLENAKAAREEIQAAAQKTQEGLQVHFGDVVTSALHAVGFDEYEFCPVFERRRNKTECDMTLSKGGKFFKPEHYVGGGVLDICSYALRMALWKLEGTAPVLLFDEPFKNADKDLLPNISRLVSESQKEFDVQTIVVTHYDELEGADKEFLIENGRVV